jgi:hypothetical protein
MMELIDQLDQLTGNFEASVTISKRPADVWHASVRWPQDPDCPWLVGGGGSGTGGTLREALERALTK